MTEEFDAVLFDAGGVLWDLRPRPHEVFADALRRTGIDCSGDRILDAMRRADRLLDDEFATLDGKDEADFWKRYDGVVLEQLGVQVDVENFAKDLNSTLRDVFSKVESWVPYPDTVPALEAVRRRGFTTGMVSNASELARRVLRNLDMEKHFDFVVISDEVGVRKPDRRIFDIALDKARTAPSRTLFLGDKPATDIAGATRAGLTGVLVDRNDTFPDTNYVRIRDLETLRRLM